MNTTPPSLDLTRQLCTRAGMIMEDASAEALLWNGSIEALDGLALALVEAQALIAAARTIAGRSRAV